MNIKNYTSNVDPDTSIANIERMLSDFGARGIMKEFESGTVSALYFQIADPADPKGKNTIAIRLPINHRGVYAVLRKRIKRWDNRKETTVRAQAMRTSWRLMQDWLEVQLSLVQMQQVDLLQVFLPYVWFNNESFYAIAVRQRLVGLPAPKENDSTE